MATKTSRIPRKAKRFFWGEICSFRKLQIFISQTTDSHFANYRFSFCKPQIFISQTTDFHFANYRFPFGKLQISISFRSISFRPISFHCNYSIPFGGMPLSLLHWFLQWPSLDGKTERCGYMTGNRSRFSKYLMAGSPVFSINFTNRLIPAKPKYLMSIENSQAILKYFIDLKSETSINQMLDLRSIKHFRIA